MLRSTITSHGFILWRFLARLMVVFDSLRIIRLGRERIRWNIWRRRLAMFGEGSIIYPYVVVHSPECVKVGANVSIAEFVHMWGGGGITIGDDVMIASHAVITSQTHDTAVVTRRANLSAPVEIASNVWIGAGAVILPGVKIGRDAVVAAGAIVISDVPARTIVAGVPASILRELG